MRQIENVIVPACQQYGFKSLPDDVLRNVIDVWLRQVSDKFDAKQNLNESIMQSQFKERECIRKLALVNRQFRDVIYAMPRCFNDFGYGRPLAEKDRRSVALRLSRYPNLDLYVSDAQSPIQIDCIKEASSLRIPYVEIGIGRAQFIAAEEPTRLSKLSALRIDYTRNAVDFFRAYATPNLQSLSMIALKSDMTFASDLKRLASLTELHLTLEESQIQQVRELVGANGSLSALRHLDIRLTLVVDSMMQIESVNIIPPPLKVLKIDVSSYGNAQSIFDFTVASHIVMDVQELYLRFRTY